MQHEYISTQGISTPQGETIWRGRFAFSLAWIVKQRRDPNISMETLDSGKDFRRNGYNSLIDSLSPDTSVTFRLDNGAPRAKGRYRLWVMGEARASTQADARARCRALRNALLLTFRSHKGYHFRALPTNDWPKAGATVWTEIQPRSAVISDTLEDRLTPAGFTGRQPDKRNRTRIRVPLPCPYKSEQVPLFMLLDAWHSQLEIEVTFHGERLTGDQRAALGRMLEVIETRNPRIFYAIDAQPLEEDLINTLLPEWSKQVRQHLARRHLVRTTVRIGAKAAVTQAITTSAGRAMFPTLSFEPLPDNTEPEADAVPMDVDMRNFITPDHDLLDVLLPQPAALHEVTNLPWTLAPPPNDLPQEGVEVGDAHGRGVFLTETDRARHVYIMGATGTGKSTLLLNMVLQDIRAGKGVCLFDPHGDLFEQVLANLPRSRWQHRINDVILFDPGDYEHPVGLNFFECRTNYPEFEKNALINEVLVIIDTLYDLKLTGGPMFEQYMRFTLKLLLHQDSDTFTLIDVPPVFENRKFRNYLIEHCTDPDTITFWRQQAELVTGEGALTNMAPYVTSKLNAFTGNPLLRNILGQQRSTIDLRHIMDEKKILLVNLSKGKLSQLDTYLLGMLLLGMIFRTALGRHELPPEQRNTWNIYIDEFQNFMTASVAQMLSEVRKYGISLVMANQHLTQMNDPRKGGSIDAVLGNVANLLFFRLGVTDAERLHEFVGPNIGIQDLQYLPDHHVACRISSRLQPIRPFIFHTHPPRIQRTPAPSSLPSHQRRNHRSQIQRRPNPAEIVRANNRQFNATPRHQVEQSIRERRTAWSY